MTAGASVFWVGARGKHARVNPETKELMERGWYVMFAGSSYRRSRSGLRGPFRTKTDANFVAWGTYREPKD